MRLGQLGRTAVSEGHRRPWTAASLPHSARPMQPSRSCTAYAARDRGRDGRSRGAVSGVPGARIPQIQKLVSEGTCKDGRTADSAAPLTVYTIRFMTGTSRGAALSDPNAAVNVCLVGQNGTAALHRVSPVNDPIESRAHMKKMCQVIGPDVGVDCRIALEDAPSTSGGQQQQQQPGLAQGAQAGGSAGASVSSSAYGYSSGGRSLVGRPPPPAPPKQRFQEGSVDEVSVLLPELGPLSSVLVGVEAGTWHLDEMDVASSRTAHLDRFVCRRMLGGKQGEGAAVLTPVPAGAVVYGEGESAVVLSKDQASALWSLNMADYTDLKRRMAATTLLLVASGASLAALTGGTAAALPYTAGGIVGLLYQWMLMRGVDHVVEAATGQEHRNAAPGSGSGSGTDVAPQQPAAVAAGGAAGRVLASAPVRLGFVCASAALGLALLSQEEAAKEVATGALPTAAAAAGGGGPAAAWQLAMGALGFLTYKVALVGVSLGDASSGGGGGGLGLGKGAVPLERSSASSGGSSQVEKYKRD